MRLKRPTTMTIETTDTDMYKKYISGFYQRERHSILGMEMEVIHLNSSYNPDEMTHYCKITFMEWL